MKRYLRPHRLKEALQAFARSLVMLADSSNFYSAGVGRAIDEDVVDITAIPKLRGIAPNDMGWHIGATTCVYHKLCPAIFMVEAAEDGSRSDLAKPLNRTTGRRRRKSDAMHCAEARTLPDVYASGDLTSL